MKMTIQIDEKKIEEAMAECSVTTKTEVIDLALRELLRQKAVERATASFGTLPNLPTNSMIEEPEKRHIRRARRH